MVKESGIEFLDVKVHLRNGYLTPEIYSKERDSHEYLHPTSAYPPTVSRNSTYSVALRVRRNCSDREPGDSLFVKNLIQYKAYLLHSGYDEEKIDKHFIRVAKMGRNQHCKQEIEGIQIGIRKEGYTILLRHGILCFQILARQLKNLQKY